MAKNKVKGTDLQQAMPSPGKAETDYQTEDDMRTMHQASAVAADPGRLKKVHKLAGRKHKALTGMIEPLMQKKKPIRSLDDLKAKAKQVNDPNEPDEDDL